MATVCGVAGQALVKRNLRDLKQQVTKPIGLIDLRSLFILIQLLYAVLILSFRQMAEKNSANSQIFFKQRNDNKIH
ncbi:MAG TPA: hypothetical protein DDZ80_14650 [Cyanobacteria bacterium UBA8803]|nr:hypothetical protein [Cyanobacteria bacterium UBA9273]HBL59672.1 hypothetical protein [Cyanobacteria bacterium UBA8803]